MRKQDVKPGVVYAYREGSYSDIKPVVFLTAPADGRVYVRSSRRGEAGAVYFTIAREGTKAGRYAGGYAAVMLGGKDPASNAAQFTLDSFEAATSVLTDAGTYTLVTSLAYIIGPYGEVVAEREAGFRARREERDRELAVEADSRRRADVVIAALAKAGVAAGRLPSYGGVDQIPLPLAEAEKLLALLAAQDGD